MICNDMSAVSYDENIMICHVPSGFISRSTLFCVGDANKRTLKNEKRSNLKLMNEVSNN